MIDNGRLFKEQSTGSGKPLESVAHRLKGKQGRMRLNMLGKRVDYSARTVIVVDPELRLDECGLPFVIAKTMFEGFLIAELRRELGPVPGQESVPNDQELIRRFSLKDEKEQWDLLTRAIGHRCVMLNRAPTLHRLSVQAFRPKLVTGQALKIHPLVCAPFNADFDGDTMTVHLALGEEAQKELSELMLPSRNLNSPATGDPVIGPTQDMVLGIYFLTQAPAPDIPERVCRSLEELEHVAEACSAGDVAHNAPVTVPISVLKEASPEAVADDPRLSGTEGDVEDPVRTTAGRCLFFLLVHRGFDPPPRPDVKLLRELDSVPLAAPAAVS
mmetsp:Transcript_58911/g.167519  ORF Transcript_58911/g.167519 Transcript_58911/m.167519 type:complete len:329 (+) Transcript_58911:3-989(+)